MTGALHLAIHVMIKYSRLEYWQKVRCKPTKEGALLEVEEKGRNGQI